MQSLYKDASPRERNTSPTTRRKISLLNLCYFLSLSWQTLSSIVTHDHLMVYTGSQLPNYIAPVSERVLAITMDHYLFSSCRSYFLFMPVQTYGANNIKRIVISDYQGNVVGFSASPFGGISHQGMGYAANKIFLSANGKVRVLMTLTESSGTFALSNDNTASMSLDFMTAPVQDYPLNSYLYLSVYNPSVTADVYYKFNIVTFTEVTSFTDSNVGSTFNFCSNINDLSYICYFTSVAQVSKLNMNLLKRHTTASVYIFYHSKLHKGSKLLHATHPDNAMNTAVYDIFGSTSTATLTLKSSTTHVVPYHMVACLGAFNYAILVSTTTPNSLVVNSESHTYFQYKLSCFTDTDALYSIPDPYCVSYKSDYDYYLCYILKVFKTGTSSINVISLRLSSDDIPKRVVDNCFKYSLSDPTQCFSCFNGYTLTSQNTCTLNANLNGAVAYTYPSTYYGTTFYESCPLCKQNTPICPINNCTECDSQSSITCSKCRGGYARRVPTNNLNPYTCELISTLVNEGISTDLIIYPCTDTYCIYCANNYQSCARCGVFLGQTRYLYNGGCYLYSNLPVGVGAYTDGTNYYGYNCNVQYCKLCYADFRYCELCQTGYVLWNNICYSSSSSLPTGVGNDPATSIAKACNTAGCYDCNMDYRTCLTCNTSPNILYLSGNVCYLPTALPNGIGPNSAPVYKGLACQDVNCRDCRTTYTACTGCYSPVTPQYFLYNSACVLPTNIPDLMGGSLTTFQVTACTDTNCQKCASDNTKCTLCKQPYSYTLYIYNYVCTPASSLPDLIGAKLTDLSTTNCLDPNCQKCQNDYTKCTLCKTATSGNPQYFLYLDACKLPTELPNGQGADSTTLTAKACNDVTNCLICQANYMQCMKCKTASSPTTQYYLYQTQCVLFSNLPATIGANPTTLEAQACLDANCNDCKANKDVCMNCNPTGSSSTQRYAYNGVCVLASTLPSGTGIDTTNYAAVACVATNCDNCKTTSYTQCTACIANYAFRSSSACEAIASLTREGVDSSGYIVPCQNTLCLSCNNNYAVCTACGVTGANTAYLYNSQCYLPINLPDGIGAVTSGTFTTMTCDTANCLNCRDNYLICKGCKSSPTVYYLYNNLCQTSLSGISAGFGNDPLTNVIRPCKSTGCTDCLTNYETCGTCSTSPQQYLYNSVCYLPTDLPPGIGPEFTYKTGIPCQDTNCKNCKTAYTVCDDCYSPVTPQYVVYQAACVLPSTLPDFIGADKITFKAAACLDTNCMVCQQDILVCNVCKSSLSPQVYLYQGSCKVASLLPPGIGPDLTAFTGVACKDPHCSNCKRDFNECDDCYHPATPQYFLDGVVCKLPVDLADYTGADLTNFKTGPCSNTDCQKCQTDKTKCDKCKGSISPQSYHYNNDCKVPSLLPSRIGPDLVNLEGVPCKDTNCDNCKTDFNICSDCLTPTTPQYYLYAGACKLPTDLPDMTGPNLDTKRTQPCQDPSCLQCQSDYTLCDVCIHPATPQLYLYNRKCVDPSTLPPGIGPNTATFQAEPCTDTNCKECKLTSSSVCTACYSPVTPQFFLYNSACSAPANLPALVGADLTSFLTGPCTDPNCLNCKSDRSKCDECKSPASPQYFLYQSACKLPVDLPAGIGANTGTFKTQSCADGNCKDCQSDFGVCRECYNPVTPQYYLYQDACKLPVDLSNYIGADKTTFKAVPCTDPNCLNCQEDYTYCNVCKHPADPQYFFHLGQCYLPTNLPTKYGPDFFAFASHLCKDPNCDNCKRDFNECDACLGPTTPQYYLYYSECKLRTEMPVGTPVDTTTFIAVSCTVLRCRECYADKDICTACHSPVSPQSYLYNNKCDYPDSLPSGIGPDLTAFTGVACKDPHCSNCKRDFNECDDCYHPATPQYFLDGVVCKLPVDLADYTGADLTNFKTGQCIVQDCMKCQGDRSKCNQCVSPAIPQLYIDNNACVDPTSLPDGMGPNKITFITQACKDINCKNCKGDYSICDECYNPVTPQYYLYAGACKLPTDLPDMTGPNLDTKRTQPCQDPSCLQCQSDYTLCDVCIHPATPQLYLYNRKCVDPSTLPPGIGPNTATFQAEPCTDSNCKECKLTSSSVCTACYSPVTPQFFLYNSACSAPANLPALVGADLTSFLTGPCTDPNCLNCKSDRSKCDECKSPASPQYFLYQSACKLPTDLPAGIGANTGTFKTQSCADGNCKDCQSDFGVCRECYNPVTPQYYLYQAACKIPVDLPSNIGANLVAFTSQQCIEQLECLECKEDYLKCTSCDSANGFYLDPATYLCVLVTDIPGGYGANLMTKEVSLCAEGSQCLKCQSNHTQCTSCDYSKNYFLNTATQVCVLRTNIPNGFGANIPAIQVATCQQGTMCLQCQFDFTKCTLCDTSTDFYLDTTTSLCVFKSLIPPGYGAGLTSLHVTQCQEYPNCKLCQSDHTKCTLCDTTNRYYLNITSAKCIQIPNIRTGFGANLVTLEVDPCAQGTNCVECKTDNKKCEICNTAKGFFLNSATGICEDASTFPIGWGPNHNTSSTAGCASPGCLHCLTDMNICTLCDVDKEFFLYQEQNQCVNLYDIPQGFGADRDRKIITPCTSPNCWICQLDFAVCQACHVPDKYCFDGEYSTCIHFKDIPPLSGCNINTGNITSCKEMGCANCSESHLLCKKCDPVMGFYLSSDGTCKDLQSLDQGLGVNITTSLAENCTVSGCLDCRSDSSSCFMCDEAKNYTLTKGVCVLKVVSTEVHKLKRAFITAVPSTVNWEYTTTSSFRNKTLVATLIDATGKIWSDPLLLPITVDNTLLTVTVKIEENIYGAKMIVDVANATDSNSTDTTEIATEVIGGIKLPIIQKEINILNSKAAQAIAASVNNLVDSASGMRSGASIALALASPASGVVLDSLFADFKYMGMTGPATARFTYPSLIFSMVSSSKVLPIDFPNLFESFAIDSTCVPSAGIASMGNDCSFLQNYGEDIGMLLLNLLVNIVFMILGYALTCFTRKRAHLRKNKVMKTMHNITQAFGIRFFLLKMDGNVVEIMILAINGIATMRSGSNRFVANLSTIASSIFILYYLIYGYFLYQVCKDTISCVKQQQHLTDNKDANEMQEAFKLSKVSYRMMQYVFDGYSYPISTTLLWSPMWMMARNVIVGMLIVLLSEYELIQLPLLLIVEGGLYLYLLVAKIRASKIEYFVETSITFMRVVFVLMSLLSFTPLGDDDPNGVVGIGMVVALILNAAISLFGILALAFLFLIESIQSNVLQEEDYTGRSTRGFIHHGNNEDIDDN
jgi:hypothetical protein